MFPVKNTIVMYNFNELYINGAGNYPAPILFERNKKIKMKEKEREEREEKRKLSLSNTGQYITKLQEDLANQFFYKKLDDKLAIECMRKYVLSLPEGFCLEHNEIPVINNPEINYIVYKPGFEIIKERKFPLLSRKGTLISNGFERIVLGHYGAFIEIDKEDIYENNLILEPGQEYRMRDRKYKNKVKYIWFTTKDESCCKIYRQTREVLYADYKINMYYISPFEVLDYNELTNFLMNEGEEDE